jgi:predicted nucleic-acid-binding protein
MGSEGEGVVRVGLDTSVVLRLLIGEPQLQARAAWQAVVEIRAEAGEAVVSDLVVSETYFALQHHYGVPKREALRQLKALFESGDLVAAGCAAQVLATPGLAAAKPGFVDRMIHAGYVGNLDQMLSFEKAARRLVRTRVPRG